MANKIDEFGKSVTNVNTQIKDVEGGLKKNWTEVVKGTIKKEVKSTTVALNNVVKSIKNNVETINRECNVVLFRLSEAENKSADARNDDKKIVMNLLSVITNDEIKESDIKKMYRIGKKAEAKDKQKQESGEFLYRVMGDPSNLRIIKIQKYSIKN
ncbi:hypothetical protein HELRODRAFT_163700 [Helobdella robusta]|uniref:Uncharacterized protein n=1 Tax=Helobdella robusta TaxID=6412 RepID=T1EUD2_HELRO|nr:hypothetical protein HELRODRAFT_163700 [Helobdella robusta]ESN96613.1 hypothetical protein HELRODRAFT_163700 [Helobdella robusta]